MLLPLTAPVLLDGGLSTALEAAGHRLDTHLWTARLLIDDPTAIEDAHLASLRAGARVLTTGSYQAEPAALGRAARASQSGASLLASSTDLARNAIARFAREAGDDIAYGVLVAASLGPYGALLGGGAEYSGDYALDATVRAAHAARLAALAPTDVDLWAIETMPTGAEARLVLELVTEHDQARPTRPAWVSFTCRDDRSTWGGEAIEAAAAAVIAHPRVAAVGVNCTAPRHVLRLVERLRAVTDLPLVAYPNAGRRWDPATWGWAGDPDPIDCDLIEQWMDAGARMVGGCCGVGPAELARIGRCVARHGS